MLSLLERQIEASHERMVILAPPGARVPSHLKGATSDAAEHDDLLRQMQRLRGSVYFKDGAIGPDDLSGDGLHETAEDARSWHVLMRGRHGDLSGCIWYLEHATMPAFQQVRAHHTPLGRSTVWHDRVRKAVAAEVAMAKLERVRYSEVGGWAVSEDSCKPDCILMILATFALSRAMGGALGLATATVRHSSATILRRLGLSRLDDIPPYFDPAYSCEMELLRYDTRRSSPKYHNAIEILKQRLEAVPVLMAGAPNDAPAIALHGEPVTLAGESLALPNMVAA